MKNYVRYGFMLLFISFLTSTTNGQISLRGGVNKSNVNFNNGSIHSETNSKAGIQAGLMYKARIADRIAIRPGLIFSVKGYEENGLDVDFKYVEAPVSFLFYMSRGQNGLYFELGPYVGTGIDSDFGDFGDDLKRLDLGLNLGAGFELGRLGIGFTYGIGLANLVDGNVSDPVESIKNDNLGIFGYIEF